MSKVLIIQYNTSITTPSRLKNVVTAPTNDLKITLHFTPGSLAIDTEDAEKEITVPEEPKAA
jgi:hypothetical protein